MSEEKFISIEYEIWKNKYLPMEQEIHKLKKEIELEKNKKSGYLYVRLDSHRRFNYEVDIGILDFSIENAPMLLLEDRHRFIHNIKQIISDRLGVDKVLSNKDLEEFYTKISKERSQIQSLRQENEEKFKKIPWIIRKIFKIKL